MGYQPQGTADRFQAGLDQARQGGTVQAQRRHARTDADRRHAFPGHGHPGQSRRQGKTPRHRRLEIRRLVSADLPSSTPPRWSCIAATPPRFDCISKFAPWWWWKAQPYPFAYGATTMLALGLLLNFAGIGLFCWLIFTLAVYALPFFVLCGRPHNDKLCGVLGYVAHEQIEAVSSRNLGAARHISIRLQRAQKRHHIRLVPASNRTRRLSPCQRRQCPLFRCKVRLGIDVGRIERHVSEPSPDRIDVNARLQKMASGRVSDDMGTDSLSLE